MFPEHYSAGGESGRTRFPYNEFLEEVLPWPQMLVSPSSHREDPFLLRLRDSRWIHTSMGVAKPTLPMEGSSIAHPGRRTNRLLTLSETRRI